MKTKMISGILLTLFLTSIMAFNITPVAATGNVVGLWHFDKEFGTALEFDGTDDYNTNSTKH